MIVQPPAVADEAGDTRYQQATKARTRLSNPLRMTPPNERNTAGKQQPVTNWKPCGPTRDSASLTHIGTVDWRPCCGSGPLALGYATASNDKLTPLAETCSG